MKLKNNKGKLYSKYFIYFCFLILSSCTIASCCSSNSNSKFKSIQKYDSSNSIEPKHKVDLTSFYHSNSLTNSNNNSNSSNKDIETFFQNLEKGLKNNSMGNLYNEIKGHCKTEEYSFSDIEADTGDNCSESNIVDVAFSQYNGPNPLKERQKLYDIICSAVSSNKPSIPSLSKCLSNTINPTMLHLSPSILSILSATQTMVKRLLLSWTGKNLSNLGLNNSFPKPDVYNFFQNIQMELYTKGITINIDDLLIQGNFNDLNEIKDDIHKDNSYLVNKLFLEYETKERKYIYSKIKLASDKMRESLDNPIGLFFRILKENDPSLLGEGINATEKYFKNKRYFYLLQEDVNKGWYHSDLVEIIYLHYNKKRPHLTKEQAKKKLYNDILLALTKTRNIINNPFNNIFKKILEKKEVFPRFNTFSIVEEIKKHCAKFRYDSNAICKDINKGCYLSDLVSIVFSSKCKNKEDIRSICLAVEKCSNKSNLSNPVTPSLNNGKPASANFHPFICHLLNLFKDPKLVQGFLDNSTVEDVGHVYVKGNVINIPCPNIAFSIKIYDFLTKRHSSNNTENRLAIGRIPYFNKRQDITRRVPLKSYEYPKLKEDISFHQEFDHDNPELYPIKIKFDSKGNLDIELRLIYGTDHSKKPLSLNLSKSINIKNVEKTNKSSFILDFALYSLFQKTIILSIETMKPRILVGMKNPDIRFFAKRNVCLPSSHYNIYALARFRNTILLGKASIYKWRKTSSILVKNHVSKNVNSYIFPIEEEYDKTFSESILAFLANNNIAGFPKQMQATVFSKLSNKKRNNLILVESIFQESNKKIGINNHNQKSIKSFHHIIEDEDKQMVYFLNDYHLKELKNQTMSYNKVKSYIDNISNTYNKPIEINLKGVHNSIENKSLAKVGNMVTNSLKGSMYNLPGIITSPYLIDIDKDFYKKQETNKNTINASNILLQDIEISSIVYKKIKENSENIIKFIQNTNYLKGIKEEAIECITSKYKEYDLPPSLFEIDQTVL